MDKQLEHHYLLNGASSWLSPCHAAQPGRVSTRAPGWHTRSCARLPRTSEFWSPLSCPQPRFPHLSNGASDRPTYVTGAGLRSRKGRERPAWNCGHAGEISNPLRRGSVRKWSPCSFLPAGVIMLHCSSGLPGRSWRKSSPSRLAETHPAGRPLAGSTCSGLWDQRVGSQTAPRPSSSGVNPAACAPVSFYTKEN